VVQKAAWVSSMRLAHLHRVGSNCWPKGHFFFL